MGGTLIGNTMFDQLKTLKVAIDSDSVAEICLCRPKQLNTMNTDFWEEFPATLKAIDRHALARVVIIHAEGKHFSAGMDRDVFGHIIDSFEGEPARRAEQFRRGILDLQQALSVIEEIRMPVISAIQGACIGGGMDLVCATDMRFCSADAFFTIKETELGITADVGTLQRLQSVMPSGLAREIAYSSRPLDAAEAASCGFINKVYPRTDELIAAVRELARAIAQHSPLAVSGTKVMLNYSRDHSVADSLNYVATWQAGMLQAEDMNEAMNAVKEKRSATFANLKPHRSAIK